MREFSVPASVRVDDVDTLSTTVFALADEQPDAVALRRRVDDAWVDVTYAAFTAQIVDVARGLVASGIEPGDRIALLSRTRYEWTLFDYAIVAAGAVTVPIYETSSAEQVAWILSDSGAKAVVVEDHRHAATVTGTEDAPAHVWRIVADADWPGAVEALTTRGASVPAAAVHERRTAARGDDLATLIYTSGTTGRPKGCELTHANLLAEVRTVITVLPEVLDGHGSLLLFLPLAHVFGKVVQCAVLDSRTVLGHSPDAKHLLDDLGTFQPTVLLAVPRVFEKVFHGARRKAVDGGKGKIFDAAAATAVAWSRACDTGGPGAGLRLRRALFDALIYRRLRAALGGHVRAAVSGSAPLTEHLGHFFRGVGVPVLEGYGLTETTAAISVNTMSAQRIGTVGRPIPGQTIRIADDGEILVRGPVVFRGYHGNPDATAEAVTDGWFHTGDVGELDEAGFLRITGRKKELIVTAGGKNVAPAVLEDRLRAHPLVGQVLVVGDGQPFIAALVTVDAEALPRWRRRHGKPEGDGSAADLVDDPELRGEIAAAVEEANRAVSRAEQIRKFRILPGDFTEEGGELTPTLKVRRSVVTSRYADDVAALYSGVNQPA
ncbi:AMP-dependent synthetase/ligase [Pseudonocardia charpentierae]|uniref:AMP-dependent synthetase/ligase n=1 Tax=Pseudonocardia charpentierae TaxID=3075545 RepID=A0ABU2NA76_9PSEU|nr:AMP-dependent synthetase/ligase [Pseudonocardia sp. DSM 45834]MDT0350626.1 AMP-dependent synthetase/ligase [Pseudonocardia sp. DSM 45834]